MNVGTTEPITNGDAKGIKVDMCLFFFFGTTVFEHQIEVLTNLYLRSVKSQ